MWSAVLFTRAGGETVPVANWLVRHTKTQTCVLIKIAPLTDRSTVNVHNINYDVDVLYDAAGIRRFDRKSWIWPRTTTEVYSQRASDDARYWTRAGMSQSAWHTLDWLIDWVRLNVPPNTL